MDCLLDEGERGIEEGINGRLVLVKEVNNRSFLPIVFPDIFLPIWIR
jgi:hypothetical protein